MKQNNIIYQLALRTFTPEGTLCAATKHLESLKELGVDWIYLTACFKADADPDRQTWSPRQIASGCDNPNNPYKIADYFHVDEEYGSDEDLCAFIARAHTLGLKVMLDLVYLHCGRNAPFLKQHPDYVLQNADGSFVIGERWPFARINFSNSSAREYLFRNAEYLTKAFHADGFRCDSGDSVPHDFWKECIDRVKKINPDITFLNEGVKEEYLDCFDLDYYTIEFKDLLEKNDPASMLENAERKFRRGQNNINYIENHDVASDSERFDKQYSAQQADLALFLLYVMPGVPYIWNGNEYADTNENCMFSNRFFGNRSFMNPKAGMSKRGKERFSFLQKLNKLYHTHPALSRGSYDGYVQADKAVAVTRKCESESICAVFNPSDRAVNISDLSESRILIDSGTEKFEGGYRLNPFGFLLLIQ